MFDFEKNKFVDSLDAVPEKYRPLYAEITDGDDSGKFGVAEQFTGIVSDYTGTNKALSTARADKKTASDESAKRRVALRAYDEIFDMLDLDEESRNADSLKEKINEFVDGAKNGKELKINLDKMKAEMSKKHSGELSDKDKVISEITGALSDHLIGDVATRELTNQKGAVDLLMPHVRSHASVVKTDSGKYRVNVIDGEGEVRFNGAGETMGISDLVAEMKSDERFSRAFESETPGGSGSKQSSLNRSTSQRTSLQNGDRSSHDKISSGLKNKNRQ